MIRRALEIWEIQGKAVSLIETAAAVVDSTLSKIVVVSFGDANQKEKVDAALVDPTGNGYSIEVFPPSLARTAESPHANATLNCALAVNIRNNPIVSSKALPAIKPLMVVDAIIKAIAAEGRDNPQGFRIGPTILEDVAEDQGVYIYRLTFVRMQTTKS